MQQSEIESIEAQRFLKLLKDANVLERLNKLESKLNTPSLAVTESINEQDPVKPTAPEETEVPAPVDQVDRGTSTVPQSPEQAQ